MVVLAIILVILAVILVMLLMLDGQQQDQLGQALRSIEETRQETIRSLFDAARESGAFRDQD